MESRHMITITSTFDGQRRDNITWVWESRGRRAPLKWRTAEWDQVRRLPIEECTRPRCWLNIDDRHIVRDWRTPVRMHLVGDPTPKPDALRVHHLFMQRINPRQFVMITGNWIISQLSFIAIKYFCIYRMMWRSSVKFC
jgi:hypothetical protein